MELKINGQRYDYEGDPEQPLLWVLRDEIGLTGTKYGCGIGQCGACTVHIDGRAVRSCVTPVRQAFGKQVTTIEGLARDGELHPLQEAFREEHALQCGRRFVAPRKEAGNDHDLAGGEPVANPIASSSACSASS